MKNILKRVISFIIAISLFAFCSLSVYASDHGGGGASSSTRTLIKAQESKENREKIEDFLKQYFKDVSGFFVYAASQVGCVLTGQYKDAYESWLTMEDIINETGLYINENGTPVDFYISTTLMKQIKQAIDDYAAENQPFKVEKTYRMAQIPASAFGQKPAYEMFKSYFGTSYSYVLCNPQGSYGFIGDLTPCIKGGGGFIKSGNHITVMDGDWKYYSTPVNKYFNRVDEEGKAYVEIIENFGTNGYLDHYDSKKTDFAKYGQYAFIVTPDGGNIRVFNTGSDFINYSVGQRKIYYTSNYYDYVPEDLQVSIDDLQKTIDDMQDVIDKLLDQIGNDTSESEIEELLRQILEALKNNQGGGGSGGGGDVTVDIDLSTTNGWLSKIYKKVSEIFDKISAGSAGTGGNILQESLDAVLARLDDLNIMLKKYLSEITGDLDDIKGQLASMSEQEFEEKSDSFLGEVMDAFSEISEVVKTKFPFSIPNDLRIFLSKIAPAPSEAEAALYFNETSSVLLYSGDHGGGGSTDGEPNPPGGGGASRPGSSFVGVEHGGGGGAREPAEMREAPVFRLPIVIERYGIEEYIIIDMTPFDPLSRFSRSFFTVIFMVCLFNLTFKVIGMWGDIIG